MAVSRGVLFVLVAAAACGSPARAPTTAHDASPAVIDFAAFVDPFIGTGGHGHTYPGASVPFGMVQLSPDTRTEGWDGCSGYHASDTSLLGFSHTHLSGTGIADLGDVLFLPVTGQVELDGDHRARFSHESERATAGDYRVELADSGIDVELTATTHAGFHRYKFPNRHDAGVIVDLRHGIQNRATEVALNVDDDHTLTGYRRSTGWARERVVYFVAAFSEPFASSATKDGKAYVRFQIPDGHDLLVKVGISAVGVDGARKNLDAEIPKWDFDETRAAARRAWNGMLARVAVTDADADERRIFTTALYHSMLAPTVFADVDRRFRGSDGAVHGDPGFRYYSTFSLWDTFRAAHPLYTLATPELVPDMVQSLLAQAEHHPNKLDPIWPLASWETEAMVGQHSIPVVVEAITKGLAPGVDASRAYAILKEGEKRYGGWRSVGYVAANDEDESASKTLEAAYDDAALARLAALVGREDDSRALAESSQAYRKLFDSETGFFRPRASNGAFVTPFDPRATSRKTEDGKSIRDYTEGNAWEYLWFVPHDVSGLIALLGGRAAFAAKLDAFFAPRPARNETLLDMTGLIGEYAQGNEPSHHVAFLYTYAGQPYKTQSRVREILDTMYTAGRDGLPGNEDCGQMSAWYVLASLGIYPVNPPDGIYVLTSPNVRRAELRVGSRPFVITSNASRDNRYIQSVLLNGEPLDRPWIRHAEIARGGTLAYTLGPLPNERYGAAPEVMPPSQRTPN